ncbi:MAG: SDR family oxidoreductase [Planctomycetota bacterium]
MDSETARLDPAAATGERTEPPRVLVTGATGYVGGRLVPRLLERGYRVRCLVREPRKLADRPWRHKPGLEVVGGELADLPTVERALSGCDAGFYLVHSMNSAGSSYRAQDERLATGFATAAKQSGLKRIIYLGGLGEIGSNLSEHLASRRSVEHLLGSTGVPVTVFRAAMIIGSGSASFEILRYLVEHLPVMVTPRWVRTESQPIAIRNVLHYLVECLSTPETIGETLDIGGPDIVSYRELMRLMSTARGLGPRLILPVPVLTPRLSSLWIHLVTPVPHTIARPLAEGLRNRTVCRDSQAAMLMPQPLLRMDEAIDAALGKKVDGMIETAWTDAGVIPGDPNWAGGTTFDDGRETEVLADAQTVFETISRIGGDTGWYDGNWLWRLRGFLDKVIGGPGLRRGRRDPNRLQVGDALDFWRVVDVVPDRLVELRAEMRLPGIAFLRLESEESSTGQTRLRLTARFKPRGLLGILYWFSVLPMHGFVFPSMLRGLKRDAERRQSERETETQGA